MVGARIPTEEQLCSEYNVSRATVRLAIEELVASGYLKRFQGKGTFVRRRNPDNSIAMLTHFGDNEICHSFSCITRVLDSRSIRPSDEVKDHLDLADGDHCFYAMRLIISDCTPFILQRLYVVHGRMAEVPDTAAMASLAPHSCLERLCGRRVQRVRELSDVSPVGEKDKEALELSSSAPVLRTRRTYYAQGDIPMGFSESLYRTDACSRAVVFERLNS